MEEMLTFSQPCVHTKNLYFKAVTRLTEEETRAPEGLGALTELASKLN